MSHAIAGAADRVDHGRVPELAAQGHDGHADRVGERVGPLVPDLLEQLVRSDDGAAESRLQGGRIRFLPWRPQSPGLGHPGRHEHLEHPVGHPGRHRAAALLAANHLYRQCGFKAAKKIVKIVETETSSDVQLGDFWSSGNTAAMITGETGKNLTQRHVFQNNLTLAPRKGIIKFSI